MHTCWTVIVGICIGLHRLLYCLLRMEYTCICLCVFIYECVNVCIFVFSLKNIKSSTIRKKINRLRISMSLFGAYTTQCTQSERVGYFICISLCAYPIRWLHIYIISRLYMPMINIYIASPIISLCRCACGCVQYQV